MSLEVKVEKKEAGTFAIIPVGSIDSETYTILEEVVKPLLEPSTKLIIFDLKDTVYMSSIGVTTILKIKNSLEAYGGSILLSNLQPQVKKVFDIIKALPTENIFESAKELDDYLAKMQKKEMEKEKPL